MNEKKPMKIWVALVNGKFSPAFKIGNQTFHLTARTAKEEALFFCDMLYIAFEDTYNIELGGSV